MHSSSVWRRSFVTWSFSDLSSITFMATVSSAVRDESTGDIVLTLIYGGAESSANPVG